MNILLKIKTLIFLLLLGFLLPQQASATHFMGADMTYICAPPPNNNPCVYRILHKAYYDCTGAATSPLPGPPQTPFLNITSPCGQPTPVGTWVFVSYTEVTPICPDTSTRCTDNSANINGVVEGVYYQDYDLCALPAGCTIDFSWSGCCRNNIITTLTNPGGDNIFVSTSITTGQTPCNNSPQFNFKPIPYICLGLPYTFNQGATDPDGDSLSYNLVPCLTTATNQVSYNNPGGFNATTPLGAGSTVILDPVTGDLTVTPTTMQVAVICVQVTEWRNGVAINSVTRDIQVTVINCTGNPPTTTGINGSNTFITNACGGELVCFDIPTEADSGRILTVYWNNSISGGIFTSSNGTQIDTIRGTNPTARFCWQTSPNQTGLYQFVVTMVDDNCPIQQQNQYSFQIQVTPPIPITITGPTTICKGDSTTLNILGGTSNWSWTPTTGLSNPNIRNPVFFPDQTTTYCVSSGGGDCPLVSECVTIVVNTPPVATACNDTFTCEGSGGVRICANVTGGATPYIYVWNPNNGSLTDANTTSPLANPDSTTTYTFYAIGDDGCRSNLTNLTVTVYPLPVVDAGPDLEFCEDSPGVFLQGTITNPQGGYSVRWIPSTGLYCDTCLVTYAVPPANTIYTLYARSHISGCISDSTTLNAQSNMTVTVKPRPVVWAGLDTTICQGDVAQLYATTTNAGPNYTYDWQPHMGLNNPALINPTAGPPHTVDYFVVATSNGCESEADTITVNVTPVPVMFAGAVRNICEGDSTVLLAHVQQGIANGFIWSPSGGLNDPSLLNPNASPSATTTYSVRAISGNCFSQPADVLVIVHSVPKPDAGFDTTICSTADSIMLQGSFTGGTPPYVTRWSPASGVDIPNIPTPKAMPNSTTMYYFSVKCGTGVSECTAYDSVLVSIIPGITAELKADTNIICPGQNVNLQVQGGQGAATYLWSPTTGISNPGSHTIIASPITNTTYNVYVSEGGCADTATIEISVHPQPIGGFVMSQPAGCNPVEVQFNNLSSNAISHTWNFGDGSVRNNEINPKHTFTESGVYTVELVVRGVGGCLDTFRSDLPITISDRFLADFSSTPTSPVEMANPASEVFFLDRSQGAVSWFWDFGDGSTSTEQNPVYKFKLPGKYIVTLKAKNQGGCEGSISKGPYVVFEPELYLPNVFSPNGDGLNDFFAIQYDGDEAFYIQIFDRWGVKYFDTRNKMQFWDGRDLNGKEAGEGTYFYTVIIGPRSYSGTVSIVR